MNLHIWISQVLVDSRTCNCNLGIPIPLFFCVNYTYLFRYGDNLNPWGDLISMARAYCVSQPNAMALVGIPAGPKDKIVFNSHRIYGPIMLTNMFANWKLEYTNTDFDKYDGKCDEYSCYQPLFLLRKL